MKKTKRYQTGGPIKPNYQTLGDIKFDSNKARWSTDKSHLIVTDEVTGKEFGVNRNIDGSYRWKGEAEQKHHANILDSLNPKDWGVTDYTPEPNFTNAFNLAKADKQKEFFWRGNRYSTKDIAKPIAHGIEVARQQVLDNLEKKKQSIQYVPELQDSMAAAFNSNVPQEERLKFILQKTLGEASTRNLDSLSKKQEAKIADFYDKKIDRLRNINPVVTSQKGNLTEDGYVRYTNGKRDMFVYAPDSLRAVNTARHEFEHIAQDFEDVTPMQRDYNKLLSMANNNPSFIRNYGQESFDYLSNPDEVGARLFNLQTLMKEKNLKNVSEAISWSKKNRKYDENKAFNPTVVTRGFDTTDPNYDVHQLIDLYFGDPKLLETHLKEYQTPVKTRFNTGGNLTMKKRKCATGGTTSFLDQLGSVAGTVAPFIGAAGAIIPALASIFKGPDHTVVSASPGNYDMGGPIDSLLTQPMVRDNTRVRPMPLPANAIQDSIWNSVFQQPLQTKLYDPTNYVQSPLGARHVGFESSGKVKSKDRFHEKATGGDIPLSSDSFQVQGNPQTTDGNTYGNVKLDHNEVITQTQQGNQFVFSDDLKHPSGLSYAIIAKRHSAAKGKAEKILKLSPYDEQAKSTISQSNALLEQLANQQEAQATQMGLRNNDGSTKQQFATGGDAGPGDPTYMSIPNQPGYFYDPYNNKVLRRDNSTGKYVDVGVRGDRYKPSQEAIQAHLSQYPLSVPQQVPVTPQVTAPQNIGPVNPNYIGDRTFGDNTIPEALTPTTATPTTTGKQTSNTSKSKSTVPAWLTAGRTFMKNTPAAPTNERPELTGFDGLTAPNFPSPNEAVKITSPYFNLYNSPGNALADPVQDMSTYKSSSTDGQDSSYKTPWTFGDTLKAIELGAKGIGAFDRPEKEKPLLDNTQITQQSYDPSSTLQQTQRNFQNFANTAGNTSINMRRSLLNNALANKYASDNATLTQYDQMNKGAKTDYQQRVSAQRQFNVQSQFNTNNINAANRAAQDALQQNFFSSIGQFGEDLNRKRYADDSINLLKTQYPDIFNSYINTLQYGQ